MKFFRYILIFLAGFLSCMLILNSFSAVETPYGKNVTNVTSPQNRINEDQIVIFSDRIIIKLDDASLSKYAATGSMKPVLDKGANGIRIKPNSVDEIHRGDIITYTFNGKLIVHRVIDKGVDTKGIYFITKGDNNEFSDKKIRFEDIKYVTVGVLY